jgi:hypothetical protein
VAQIAKALGISEPCLRNWMARADVDEGRKRGSDQRRAQELVVLRREAFSKHLQKNANPAWASAVTTGEPVVLGTTSGSTWRRIRSPANRTLAAGTIIAERLRTTLHKHPGPATPGMHRRPRCGVNWPHHVFLSQDLKVIGADGE